MDLSQLGLWDAALVGIVTLQAGFIAYLYRHKWKVLVFSLPIPFTVAALAVGKPVGTANAVGMLLFVGFIHGVRFLHYNGRVPIVPSIAICSIAYFAAGFVLHPHVPPGEIAFWSAMGAVVISAALLHSLTPHVVEPGHRTPLPVWIKMPVTAAILLFLVIVKSQLQGFVTTFPMIAIMTVYEARKSLWTVSKQLPVVLVVISIMIVACKLGQDRIGLGASLAIGWCAVLTFLIPCTIYQWSRPPRRSFSRRGASSRLPADPSDRDTDAE